VAAEGSVKHGEAPSFLIWCGPLLFMFGMAWAWLVTAIVAKTITVLDTPARSALLIGAGMLGTIVGQAGVLWTWRQSVGPVDDTLRPSDHSAARRQKATDHEPAHDAAPNRPEVRR
jgi:hypothetical protein